MISDPNTSQRAVIRINDRGLDLWTAKALTFPEKTIAEAAPGLECGEIVTVRLPDGRFGGIGYFNIHSKLPLRILTFEDRAINNDYWRLLLDDALRYRRRFYSPGDSCRLIFGEADRIPGLIVDVFGPVVVVQITTAGLERFLEPIIEELEILLDPEAIILACDSLPRKKEHLPLYRKVVRGQRDKPFFADIDGVEHCIDPLNGHKTGFFLDHRNNRKMAASMCTGRKVLDMFCYSGAFAIRAALAGAESVTAVDIFEPAIQWGETTAAHHECTDSLHFVRAEAFEYLKHPEHLWDLIFLDPPSFVRGSRRARRNMSNYIRINRLALNALAPNGILVTSCCSFHVSPGDFSDIVGTSLHQAHRFARIFHKGSPSPDHPILPDVPGTDYLKCLFLGSSDN